MAVTEADLEILESYLDGELPLEQADDLRRRLASEPSLASILESLRGERQLRMNFYRACEPGDKTVSRLLGRVERKVEDHYRWSKRLSTLRFASAAAACIVIGWIGRGVLHTRPAMEQPVTTVAQVSRPDESRGPVELPIVDDYGRVVAVQHFDSPDQAKEFVANDFRQWQEKQEQGTVVPVSAAEKF